MSSNQLLAVMDAAMDAVVLIDATGAILAFNRAAERIFGWNADEVQGRNVKMLMPEPDRSGHDGYLARYLATGLSSVIGAGRELQAQRRDGTQFPAHLSVGRVAGTDPAQFIGLIRDITEERKTLARLRLERDLAGAYLQLGHSILLMLDASRHIRAISPQACELLGAPEAQLIGQDWGEAAFDAEARAILHAELDAIQQDMPKQIHVFDLPVRTVPGGQRLVEWRCSVLRDDGGETLGFICAGKDVTAEREEEEQVRRSTERLMHVSRMAIMGEMAAGIAHELNQPLAAIANYAHASERFLRMPVPDLEETSEAVREIAAEALRAGTIIRRLRHLVRDTDDRREQLQVEDLIEELRLLTQAEGRIHDTRISFDPQPCPMLNVHRVQITQVLLNLIRNALESLSRDVPGNREILVRSRYLETGDCEMAVCDNGPGVAPEILGRMFDPFHSTKRNGTGLGLPMCQTIAQAHGGSVRYQPVEPRGACFVLTLPVARSPE